jgi:hypothetical protein
LRIEGRPPAVPRHREIKEGTVRAICKQLEIPRPLADAQVEKRYSGHPAPPALPLVIHASFPYPRTAQQELP